MEYVVVIQGVNVVVHIVSCILYELTRASRNVSFIRYHSTVNKYLHLLVAAAEFKLMKSIDRKA